MAELTDVQPEDLYACCGCCCGIQSIYTKFPQCCGCKAEGVVCGCYQVEAAFCKATCWAENNTENKLCVCFEGGSYCVKPSTCCHFQNQLFCLDGRMSIPCTEKVPT